MSRLADLRRAVKPMQFGPIAYGGPSGFLHSNTYRRALARVLGATVVDYDSLAWQRAIAATPDVTLTRLDEGESLDGVPRVYWQMPVTVLGRPGATLVACCADPLYLGPSGNVRVQIVRPGDPPFDDPIEMRGKPTHDVHGRRLRAPTNEIQIACPPADAWRQLVREAKILAFGGVLVVVAACAGGGAPVTPDGSADAAIDAAADAAADARTDAGMDAATDAAPGGLGLEADCDPTLDECEAGLTCRPDGKLRGNCRPVGTLPAGAACQAEGECGYAMTWFSDPVGVARCAVVCNTMAPQPRCKPNQPCLSLVGRLGICAP